MSNVTGTTRWHDPVSLLNRLFVHGVAQYATGSIKSEAGTHPV
jgi:hypothetical protein